MAVYGMHERRELPAPQVGSEKKHTFAARLCCFKILDAIIDDDLRDVLSSVLRKFTELGKLAPQVEVLGPLDLVEVVRRLEHVLHHVEGDPRVGEGALVRQAGRHRVLAGRRETVALVGEAGAPAPRPAVDQAVGQPAVDRKEVDVVVEADERVSQGIESVDAVVGRGEQAGGPAAVERVEGLGELEEARVAVAVGGVGEREEGVRAEQVGVLVRDRRGAAVDGRPPFEGDALAGAEEVAVLEHGAGGVGAAATA